MDTGVYHHIKISQFEGPLDLLLQLIESRELEITAISLADVTDQYIICLKKVEESHSEDLADFLVLASRLIFIKSKALLPVLEADGGVEEDTEDLKRRLEEYRNIKILSQKIGELDKRKNINFSRMAEKRINVVFLPPRNATINVLHKYFDKIFKEISAEPNILPRKEIKELVKLEDKIKCLMEKINNGGIKNFSGFLGENSSRIDVVVSFLALLHLLKRKVIIVRQKGLFGEMEIIKTQKEFLIGGL